jgi:ribosomal-protein-alanine N-acetyltransferase
MIRRAEEKDIPEIVHIEEASFPMPWPDFLFRSYLDNSGFVVYEEAGNILAYMIVGDSDGKGHIMSIAVTPKSRRNEVGSKLLNWCFETLDFYGYDELTLEVRASNIAAQDFYLAKGFRKEKVVKAYYVDEDAIVMGRDIEL